MAYQKYGREGSFPFSSQSINTERKEEIKRRRSNVVVGL
jgi:hypothetical protein